MEQTGVKFRPVLLVASVAITEAAGGLGSLFTYESIPTWYATLNKSPITPPNWLFAPMWLSLYFLMGVSLYLVWNAGSGHGHRPLALSLFGIQLALNVLWSLVFFYMHSILFGAVEIVFLWYFILASIIEFRPISRVSSYLLFPYIAWVTIATILNISILWANPGV